MVAADINLDTPAGVDAAAESAADLAKKLANPIANLISVPIQSNMDFGAGPDRGMVWYTNIQPVVPFGLSEDWLVITRTILPVVYQEGLVQGGRADTAGLGDIVQSFFFSPRESPVTWGLGPVFLWPTATNNILGSGQFGAGPALVMLKQMRAQKQKCDIRRGHRFLKNCSAGGANIAPGALPAVGIGLRRLSAGASSAHGPWFSSSWPPFRPFSCA